MRFGGFDQRRILTLAGTVALAGVVVAAGVYGPSAWKVLRNQDQSDQVVIQSPVVDSGGQNTGTPNNNPNAPNSGTSAPAAVASPNLNAAPQGDTSGPKKYKEPDSNLLDKAPSIAGFFGEGNLSEAALTVAYGAAWNIHQYVDGYLFGPNAGPQMNEQDIKKYIVFHKAAWDGQVKKEASAANAKAFSDYLDVMFNRGIDAFDAKDKARIEQFHQEIHDLDTHLFRNDSSSKIYGATPFATKR
ncbi:hypothetical protein [Paradesulfitobacterium ferrireducens]|uniref:hypothetical protein n=1 Tax=Paradesulfitobacterium ferrireducens TaxID=2816476 RepID=UPI001A905E91|nr:hypothetical protein [Paradesulfitobacterium ferrireducens]